MLEVLECSSWKSNGKGLKGLHNFKEKFGPIFGAQKIFSTFPGVIDPYGIDNAHIYIFEIIPIRYAIIRKFSAPKLAIYCFFTMKNKL